jgi:hypothetical protein
MHFIEEVFHVAPDGGTGVLELTLALVFLMLPLAVMALRRKRARG